MATSKADILMDGAYLITLTTVEGAFYGFTFALYIFCAWSLYLQLGDRDQRRQHLFILVYMSLLMALTFCNLAADSYHVQMSYVDHADYPDFFPVAVIGYIVCALVALMASAIQIWRLSIFWKRFQYSLFIMILPVSCLVAFLVLEIVIIVLHVQDQVPEMAALYEAMSYGAQGLLLVISVTVTLLIIGRIIMVRRTHIKLMGQTNSSSPYTSVISMLVESLALESVWVIGCMCGGVCPTNAAMFIVSYFFRSTQPFIQVLAYLLLVHRVAMKQGWEKDTQGKPTTLWWNQDELRTTRINTREAIPITCEEV